MDPSYTYKLVFDSISDASSVGAPTLVTASTEGCPNLDQPPSSSFLPSVDLSRPPPYLAPLAAASLHNQLQQFVDRLAILALPSQDSRLNSPSSSSQGTSPIYQIADSTQHPSLDEAFKDLRRRLAVPPTLAHEPPRELVPVSIVQDLRCLANALESGIDYPTFLSNWFSLTSKVSSVLPNRDTLYVDTPSFRRVSSLKCVQLVGVSTIFPVLPLQPDTGVASGLPLANLDRKRLYEALHRRKVVEISYFKGLPDSVFVNLLSKKIRNKRCITHRELQNCVRTRFEWEEKLKLVWLHA